MSIRDDARSGRVVLQELRERLMLMGGRVEAMLADAVQAVMERDVELARATIASDRRVDRAEVDLDRLCRQILGRSDLDPAELRFVSQSLKMVTDLERIGGFAVNICDCAIEIHGVSRRGYDDDVQRMGDVAGAMIKDATAAFVTGDGPGAKQVFDDGAEIDAIIETFRADLLEAVRGDRNLAHLGMTLQAIATSLSRVAEDARHFAAQVDTADAKASPSSVAPVLTLAPDTVPEDEIEEVAVAEEA